MTVELEAFDTKEEAIHRANALIASLSPEEETITKPSKKKHDLTDSMILDAMRQLGGNVSNADICGVLYGKVDTTLRSRVRHHLVKLRGQGIITQSGVKSDTRYRLAETKASTGITQAGDLFEVVGHIGDQVAVRSLDTHQIFTLAKV